MKKIQVYVGIGSNIDKVKNIRGCLSYLKDFFGEIKISPIYKSKAIGMEGNDFYNLVVRFKTNLGIKAIESKLREIEYHFGRKRDQLPHTPRTLDIDLLLFGNLISEKHNIPRGDITNYSFVLKPLYDIEPDLIHPTAGEKVSILWKKFDKSMQSIQSLESNILDSN